MTNGMNRDRAGPSLVIFNTEGPATGRRGPSSLTTRVNDPDVRRESPASTNQPTRSKPRRYERRDLCAVTALYLCANFQEAMPLVMAGRKATIVPAADPEAC